jgi:putative N6-adenine-specific DNA methylase/tRNA (guanine6-N2)-methyltransferase
VIFLLTTDSGIEDIVAEELCERQPGASVSLEPYGCPGEVRVEGAPVDDLFRLGTIHHVIEIRAEAEATTLDDVREALSGVALDELSTAASFRVTSACRGEPTLSRMDVQGAAGAVLKNRYGTKVDLEGFEINVRVDLYGRRLVAGIQRTRTSLGNRIRRGKALRSSLRPTLAVAMLRLAGAHVGPGRLTDPMCGAAVIPVEALRINPALEVSASDWDAATVETAKGTLRNHGLEIPVQLLDARTLGDGHSGHFDTIVTDPPYGLRQAKRARLTAFYRELLVSFEKALRPAGKIAIVIVKHRVFLAALARTGLRVVHQRTVAAGSVHLRLFVLERSTGS